MTFESVGDIASEMLCYCNGQRVTGSGLLQEITVAQRSLPLHRLCSLRPESPNTLSMYSLILQSDSTFPGNWALNNKV